MTPEKRAWVLRRIREIGRENHSEEPNATKSPTLKGRPLPTG